jgi:hypothetical protein
VVDHDVIFSRLHCGKGPISEPGVHAIGDGDADENTLVLPLHAAVESRLVGRKVCAHPRPRMEVRLECASSEYFVAYLPVFDRVVFLNIRICNEIGAPFRAGSPPALQLGGFVPQLTVYPMVAPICRETSLT